LSHLQPAEELIGGGEKYEALCRRCYYAPKVKEEKAKETIE